MTPSVLALDLDVTKCGVALPDGALLTLTAPTRRGKAEPAAHHRSRRLDWWLHELEHLIRYYRPDVVALEHLIPSRGWQSTVSKAEVHATARLAAYRNNATIDDTTYPSHLKAVMAGSGHASKDEMVIAAIARGATPANDDEADAALLRFMVLEQMAAAEPCESCGGDGGATDSDGTPNPWRTCKQCNGTGSSVA